MHWRSVKDCLWRIFCACSLFLTHLVVYWETTAIFDWGILVYLTLAVDCLMIRFLYFSARTYLFIPVLGFFVDDIGKQKWGVPATVEGGVMPMIYSVSTEFPRSLFALRVSYCSYYRRTVMFNGSERPLPSFSVNFLGVIFADGAQLWTRSGRNQSQLGYFHARGESCAGPGAQRWCCWSQPAVETLIYN